MSSIEGFVKQAKGVKTWTPVVKLGGATPALSIANAKFFILGPFTVLLLDISFTSDLRSNIVLTTPTTIKPTVKSPLSVTAIGGFGVIDDPTDGAARPVGIRVLTNFTETDLRVGKCTGANIGAAGVSINGIIFYENGGQLT